MNDFKIEERPLGRISFEQGDLELHIDIWGDKYAFGEVIINGLESLWNEQNLNPSGVPKRSKSHISFRWTANVISAKFICQEDLNTFRRKADELLSDKKNFLDIVKLKKEHEKEQKLRAAEYAEFHIREGKIRGGGSREEITIYHNKGDFEPYFLTKTQKRSS